MAKSDKKKPKRFKISIDLEALERLYEKRYSVTFDGDTKGAPNITLDGDGDTKGAPRIMFDGDGDTK